MTSAVSARRISKSLTAACALSVCCFAVTSCKTTSKKKSPTVMDNRELVPAPYVAPQSSKVFVTQPVASAPKPVIRPRVTTPPPRTKPGQVSPPRIKPAPAPVITREKPVVTPPPVVKPPPAVAGSQFKPVRIIKKTEAPRAIPNAKSKNIAYTVKKGDTLWDIGRAYGVSVKEICTHANLDASKVLRIGQKIELPPGARYTPPSKRPKIKAVAKKPAPRKVAPSKPPVAAIVKNTGSASAGKGKYIVQKGDSLWKIAKNHSMTTKELMSLNNLTNDRLMPGQVLVVDGAASPTAKPATGGVPPTVIITQPSNGGGSQPNVVIDVNQGVIKNSTSGAQTPPAAAVVAPKAAAATTKNLPHFVVDGDSLANIAEMYGSKVEWIKKENTGVQSDTDLKPGLRIKVPVEDIDR